MDISLYKNKRLSGTEKLHVLENLRAPSSNYKFPATTHGKQERKFLYSWLQKYKWLSYSEIENRAYCTYCVLFAPTEVGMRSSQKIGQLVQEGCQNWKKAIEKFESLFQLQYHKHAMIVLNNLKTVMEEKMNAIDRSLEVGKANQAKENAERLKPIIDTVIFCGQQGIALRSHRDYRDFNLDAMPDDNEENFRTLLRMRIEVSAEKLRDHFISCGKNATYISWNIQNEIIDACDKVIKSHRVKDVKDATFFSVLADESTDVSTQAQVSLSVRYVSHNTKDGYKINEKFLQFVPLESTTGEVLGETLLKGLEECNLEIKDLRGQGYDGASAMSGKVKGAQAIVCCRTARQYMYTARHTPLT
nr:zinc finger MYM-type protein 1-like [Leptinotarsa decemlineata]